MSHIREEHKDRGMTLVRNLMEENNGYHSLSNFAGKQREYK